MPHAPSFPEAEISGRLGKIEKAKIIGKAFSWPCGQPLRPPREDYPHDNFGFLILVDLIFLVL
jgi:hypothetical protein